MLSILSSKLKPHTKKREDGKRHHAEQKLISNPSPGWNNNETLFWIKLWVDCNGLVSRSDSINSLEVL